MTDEEWLAVILPALEIDLQYTSVFDPGDTEGIAQLRRVGRRAVHQLGHKAITRQTQPGKRADGKVVVVVLCDAQEGDPDLERIQGRSELIMGAMGGPKLSPS